MQRNVGGTERPTRLAVGAILAIVGVAGYAGLVPLAWLGVGPAFAAAFLALIGAILLATGAAQWCPISAAVGRNTCRRGADEPPADRAGSN